MYIPASQQTEGLTALANSALPLCWAIRSNSDAKGLSAAVLKEIQAVDGQMSISKVRSMEQVLSDKTAQQNFNMLLLTIFAGVALVLAAIGIYGLMSYSVEQQTAELGVRMALGAGKADLFRLVVKQGMTPALIGVACGLGIALLATKVLKNLLFGVQTYDPFSFIAVAVVLTGVALVSIYLPARRAMSLDPLIALRQE
jgi:ABC-type antimicrobial peptide transport system permease subunit